jgi:hypothetical protein
VIIFGGVRLANTEQRRKETERVCVCVCKLYKKSKLKYFFKYTMVSESHDSGCCKGLGLALWGDKA